ncbi:hypothetical protein JQR88_25510 (plasmid) [Pseudomonas luteola]|uniref:hypothetical protein n=1 Tax=Pseudomonas luteola TaxID=47886 RepID=UPI003DA14FFB
MRNKLLLLAVLPSLLLGCAQSSGVLKMGPDTYSVSATAAPARGGVSGAKRIAMTQANEECSAQGREILVKNISQGPSSPFPGGTVDITFQCLLRNDPSLHRPVYSDTPDILIETRNR